MEVFMLNYVFGGLFLLVVIFTGFSLFGSYLMKGGNNLLKTFKNTRNFEYNFNYFKSKNNTLYNRQSLDLTFDDNSNIHMFGGIDDKTIIPLASIVLNVDEDDIRAGSVHKSIEIDQFVKNFTVQTIKNIEIFNKNNEIVEYYVSKGIKFKSNKQYISISLSEEKWKNIKSIRFESTTDIDISMFYTYYAY